VRAVGLTRPQFRGVTAYDHLAAIYDEWQDRHGCFADQVLPRLERALGGFSDVSSFLDVGCGTGTLLLALAEKYSGLRLRGVDASSAMLERARQKPGAAQVEWVCAPMDRAQRPPRFAAAGAFFNTLNHLPDRDALRRVFENMAAALLPGGRLLFDVNNALGFRRWCNQGTARYGGPTWSLEIATRFDERARRSFATICVERDGQRWENDLQQRLFEDEEIAAALAGARFTVESRTAWSPYQDQVPGTTFWVARADGAPARAGRTPPSRESGQGAPRRPARRRTGARR
jgi:SAM-dependent methyltransferase